jgi:hypothetical protein|tara:strand:+ start:825 stop:1181 length:357 start_codon:yes stop_codon:yes gene_type:complete
MNGEEFPYSVKPDDTPINYNMPTDGQQAKYKEDERHQKAPPILPYELNEINEMLGNIFVTLAELRNRLSRVKDQPVQGPTQLPVNGVNKGAIDSINNKIDNINKLILDIPEDLAKIAI